MKTPRITALMSWFDEQPALLRDVVMSLEGTADALIALDGRYGRFPGRRTSSPAEQHQTLHDAASDIGLPLHSEERTAPFYGDEVDKRSVLFDLAWRHAPRGWWLIIDSDTTIHTPDPELRQRLATTTAEAALVGQLEGDYHGRLAYAQVGDTLLPNIAFGRRLGILPALFKAQPIEVVGNHWSYKSKAGKWLWGLRHEEPAQTRLIMDHRHKDRAPHRRARATRYYNQRDSEGWERFPYAHQSR